MCCNIIEVIREREEILLWVVYVFFVYKLRDWDEILMNCLKYFLFVFVVMVLIGWDIVLFWEIIKMFFLWEWCCFEG